MLRVGKVATTVPSSNASWVTRSPAERAEMGHSGGRARPHLPPGLVAARACLRIFMSSSVAAWTSGMNRMSSRPPLRAVVSQLASASGVTPRLTLWEPQQHDLEGEGLCRECDDG